MPLINLANRLEKALPRRKIDLNEGDTGFRKIKVKERGGIVLVSGSSGTKLSSVRTLSHKFFGETKSK